MIRIKPEPENTFTCPDCHSGNPLINDIVVPSLHVIADCTCKKCGLEFYQSFPVGHSVEYPLYVPKTRDNPHSGYPPTPDWFFNTFRDGVRAARTNEVAIRKIVYKKYQDVVILNTLDFLYGHVLLKLYNALYHIDNQKDLGLIVIIPKMFEWMIPKGCAEAWIVDLKLGDFAYGYTSIQRFFSEELKRFSKVFLSNAYAVPDFSKVDIERFTSVKPFNLAGFSKIKPTITFILREDRWWHRSQFDFWFYLVCRKLKLLSWGSKILSLRQNQLVKKTIREIKKELPDATIYVAGLGTTGSFEGHAIDKRSTSITTATEIEWCKLYASSHVVMGIHGSNMLLPSAHAAGCVEILPFDRYVNYAEDLSIKYNDKRQIFFFRFADQFAPPRSVKEKIVRIILCYERYNQEMCVNGYS